jgi:hypothetical protein
VDGNEPYRVTYLYYPVCDIGWTVLLIQSGIQRLIQFGEKGKNPRDFSEICNSVIVGGKKPVLILKSFMKRVDFESIIVYI